MANKRALKLVPVVVVVVGFGAVVEDVDGPVLPVAVGWANPKGEGR